MKYLYTTKTPLSQIVLTIDNNFLAHALEMLKSIGILHSFSITCRQSTLQESHSFFRLFSKMKVMPNRSDICIFFVPEKYEERVISYLSNELQLKLPGRGNLFSEPSDIISDNIPFYDEELLQKLPESKAKHFDYNLVAAIVPLGKADMIAHSVLDLGLCVPTIYFGEGIGLRNKLGLIRITIPADKEIIWFLVPAADTSILTRIVIQIGELHQPGQGILFVSGVKAYNINMHLYHDKQRHLASIDQIISTIDNMHGSTEWRKKDGGIGSNFHKNSKMSKYCNLSIIANEGSISEAITVAMSHGAGGATLSQLECNHHDDLSDSAFHASKETCDLILRAEQVDLIVHSIEEMGFLKEPHSGFLILKDVSDFLINKIYVKR